VQWQRTRESIEGHRSPVRRVGGATEPFGRLHRPALTVWLGWLWLMAGVNMAAPLYLVYAQRFAFSDLVLTLVFATYAFFLVPSLLMFGRLSDRVGRRPVILAGYAAALIGLALFTAWRPRRHGC